MAAATLLDRVRTALSAQYDVLQEQGRGGMATVNHPHILPLLDSGSPLRGDPAFEALVRQVGL